VKTKLIIRFMVFSTLLLLFLVHTFSGFAQSTVNHTVEKNVINASDAGGGDLSDKELFKIALAIAVVVLMLLFALSMIVSG
jgi:uncharacterized membrane protein SpoIIM required for sporulation